MISYEGRNNQAVNFLKTIYFDYPDWVECHPSVMPATWMKYRDEVEAIVLDHPRAFPGFTKGSVDFDFPNLQPLYESGEHVDTWGTVWKNVERGLDSIPVQEPLPDWDAFENWQPPDPLTQGDWGPRPEWKDVLAAMDKSKAGGGLAQGGGLPHGHFFMRLYYLRGFDNLMMDFATDDPRLQQLIDLVAGYSATVVAKYLELGAEVIGCGDDLGMQNALPISPGMWRRFVKPSYERIFGQCRDRDVPVVMHSDGHILEIINDLYDVGIRLINPQIRANGLPGLQQAAKGKLAINLDLDRQLFPFASKWELQDHVATAYKALHMPEGGLELHAEFEPDVPLLNIETVLTALEEVANLPEPAYRREAYAGFEGRKKPGQEAHA